MQGVVLVGFNMENYELVSQVVYVEEGVFSGLVVNLECQLWLVVGYLLMVVEGVFGLQDDGCVQFKLLVVLVFELFGKWCCIFLEVDGKCYVLEWLKQVGDGLLVVGEVKMCGIVIIVQLVVVLLCMLFVSMVDVNVCVLVILFVLQV